MKLSGRTILITGGSSGIGFELAVQLLARSNVIIITGRDEQALNDAKRRFPEIETIQSDVSDPDAIRALFKTVIERFPRLDTLVNNAGIMRNLKLGEERSIENVTLEIDVDLNGPIRMVQQFLPHLLNQRDALILNVSSGLAFVPMPISPVYSAAKAAIHAYTRCLRVQLEKSTVSVVELAPPATETPLFRDEFAEEMKGQKGMPVDVLVRRAIDSVEAGKVEIRPGLSNILKIASRIAPGVIFRQLGKVGRP
ncbi:SDR family NAD(P)-dependent oxidoreductase [Sphingomonas sp. CGMCC 1.13654]|uniref:SDR family NAD(P)-dependent oxidoreductase n=1 Tax=Sphingomonas chungangi TaxID=2683589 RepID=A0A838L7Q2_9SPHN|nr:SDR family NAD(P)-dependent oxidoreductase [Sphingomonas chungangi]MBA2933578.1 SDR family NAD(P)-dependent oxidoreductase [Sphingomonas chungangi]MVW54911.1 SDR family NAD(P)-dependent oxidoreductase [Sphingomonas chungangi]